LKSEHFSRYPVLIFGNGKPSITGSDVALIMTGVIAARA
jgi:hypothetical protein